MPTPSREDVPDRVFSNPPPATVAVLVRDVPPTVCSGGLGSAAFGCCGGRGRGRGTGGDVCAWRAQLMRVDVCPLRVLRAKRASCPQAPPGDQ